LSKQILLIT